MDAEYKKELTRKIEVMQGVLEGKPFEIRKRCGEHDWDSCLPTTPKFNWFEQDYRLKTLISADVRSIIKAEIEKGTALKFHCTNEAYAKELLEFLWELGGSGHPNIGTFSKEFYYFRPSNQTSFLGGISFDFRQAWVASKAIEILLSTGRVLHKVKERTIAQLEAELGYKLKVVGDNEGGK